MTNLKAVLGDIGAMSETFHREGGNFRKLAHTVSPPVVSSGDGALDSSIKAMAELITQLHKSLADRIEDHGAKVKYAHDSFQRNDIDVHGLFEDLMGKHKEDTPG
ncbi:DUF6317 family protein [Streptomyces sp. NPDC057654]|uniref:DUF6317 family protein n=1 Tax=Streptomyces sp. NPDC057654 TaxID=3346196 RepID=UPI0036736BF7